MYLAWYVPLVCKRELGCSADFDSHRHRRSVDYRIFEYELWTSICLRMYNVARQTCSCLFVYIPLQVPRPLPAPSAPSGLTASIAYRCLPSAYTSTSFSL